MLRQTLALTAALFLTACGTGGGGIIPWNHETERNATDTRSGYIRSDSTIYKASDGHQIRLGDSFDNKYRRGFYSFNIAGINPDAHVVEALLVVGQESDSGNPYDDLGNVIVDHVSLGGSLNAADFALANTITNNIGVLSTNPNHEQKVIDVTDAVQADLDAARTRSEFRLRFPIAFSNDGSMDAAYFNNPADDGGSGIVPRLIVKYQD